MVQKNLPGLSVYQVAKAAVIALTEVLAEEFPMALSLMFLL